MPSVTARMGYTLGSGLTVVFNLRRLKAVTKVKETVVRELLFADDCALNASTEQKMQQEMDYFSRACDYFGLTISTKKTEVMYLSLHQDSPTRIHTYGEGTGTPAVDSFTYLGSTLSRAVNIDTEINHRIAKASSTFGRLCETV